jgi:hypothetical protein
LPPAGFLSGAAPAAPHNPVENRNLPGKMRSALSPYHCLTVSMAEGGEALGTIIGEAGARQLARQAGFGRFERLPIESDMQQFFLTRP